MELKAGAKPVGQRFEVGVAAVYAKTLLSTHLNRDYGMILCQLSH